MPRALRVLLVIAVVAAVAPAGATAQLRLGGEGARGVRLASEGTTVAAAWRDADGRILVAVGRRGRAPRRVRRVPRVKRAGSVRIAVNRRGDMALMWTVNDRSEPPDPEDRFGEYCCTRVWAATMTAGGRSGPRRRLSIPGTNARPWRVAIDARGRGTVAWSDRRGLRISHGARGRRFGAPRTILPSVENQPAVVALRPRHLAHGRGFVAADGSDFSDVVRQRLSRDGAGPEQRIARLDRAGGLYQAALALSPRGRPALMWMRRSPPGKTSEVQVMAAVGDASGALGPAREVARYAGYSGGFSDAAVAVNDAGDAVFAVGQSAAAGSVVHVARARRGGAVGTTQRLNAKGYQPAPQVAIDLAGRAILAWRDGDSADRRRAMRLSRAGRTGRFSRARRFARTRRYDEPAVALTSRGVGWVGWADTRGARLLRVAPR